MHNDPLNKELPGQMIYDPGYCDHCRINTRCCYQQTGRYLDGKWYCVKCYPIMVDCSIADKKLKRLQDPIFRIYEKYKDEIDDYATRQMETYEGNTQYYALLEIARAIRTYVLD